MPNPGIRLYRVVPGANALAPLLQRFVRDGGGCVTSFEDSALRPIHRIVGAEDDVEVIPIGSLVKRILEATGERADQLATRPQMKAAIGEAAKLLDDDSILRRALRFSGNREAVAGLIRELDNGAADLDSLAQQLEGQPLLSQKLSEVNIVRKGAAGLLEKLGRNLPSEQLRLCLGNFLEPDLRLDRLFVTIFDEASEAKLEWIRWIAGQGCDVTMVAPRHATVAEPFHEANRISSFLGVEEQPVGSGNSLSNNLFAPKKTVAVSPKVTILTAANPLSECEWAVQAILDRGESEVAVFVRDTETYYPLLEATGERMGLFFSLERRTELLQNGFARLVLEFLEALVSNDVRKILPLLKRSYLVPERHVFERLEGLISSARKCGSEQWPVLHASVEDGEGIPTWLKDVLRWRVGELNESRSLGAWSGRLREFGGLLLGESPATDYDQERDSRAFHVMQQALLSAAQLEAVSQPVQYRLRQFVTQCRSLWQEADVSIPSDSEGVPVVSSVWAIPPVKFLLVLGLLEGVFPRRRREDPLLNDAERNEISRIKGGFPLQTSFEVAEIDRDAFYALCSSASDEIYLSYPATEDDRDNIPTFYLQRVREALDRVELIDKSTTPNLPVSVAKAQPLDYDPERKVQIDFLARPRNIPTTARAFRDALQCPFQYQMRYNLKLRSNAKTVAWYNLRRIPIEANLLSAPDELAAEEMLRKALQERLDELSPELSEWELRLIAGGGERLIGEWIRREFTSRRIWPRVAVRPMDSDGIATKLPGDVQLLTHVAGISQLSPTTKVLHIFDSSAPEAGELSPAQHFYYGLYFFAAHENGFASGIEVDGIEGRRSLLILNRPAFPSLRSDQAERVKVIDLTGGDDSRDAQGKFFRRVREPLKMAVEVLETGEIQPTPGEHCAICDFGELCRRSLYFSDQGDEE